MCSPHPVVLVRVLFSRVCRYVQFACRLCRLVKWRCTWHVAGLTGTALADVVVCRRKRVARALG
jgi:hypothetical protein